MLPQSGRRGETFATDLAGKRLLVRVAAHHVDIKVTSRAQSSPTFETSEGFFPHVHPHVTCHVTLNRETFSTRLAQVRLVARVDPPHVIRQVTTLEESLPAYFANIGFFARVDSTMSRHR